MSQPSTIRFEALSAKAYEHPADRAATSALRTIPLMDKVVKRLADLSHERRLRRCWWATRCASASSRCRTCGTSTWTRRGRWTWSPVPNLYVTQAPMANAMTVGTHTPIVVVASSLVSGYETDEVGAVLAHELGHVLSDHVYYTTAMVLLSRFLTGSLPKPLIGLPVRGIYLVLLEWARAAELSSDRASALVVGDPMIPCRMLMRLAGGALEGMSVDAFVTQATEYHDEEDLFARWGRAWLEIGLTHPFAVRRVRELIEWVQGGEFDRIRAGQYPRRGQEPPPTAEFEAAVAHYRERFNRMVDTVTGGVQRLGSQLDEWLRTRGAGPDLDD